MTERYLESTSARRPTRLSPERYLVDRVHRSSVNGAANPVVTPTPTINSERGKHRQIPEVIDVGSCVDSQFRASP